MYTVYWSIIQRCENPNHVSYERYGKRGIYICKEWRSDYSAFERWAIDNGWAPKLQIDRIDNDGPYSPENCHIVTAIYNTNHRSTCHFIEYNGVSKSVRDWGRESVVSISTFEARINHGWPIEKALYTPKKR